MIDPIKAPPTKSEAWCRRTCTRDIEMKAAATNQRLPILVRLANTVAAQKAAEACPEGKLDVIGSLS